MHVLAVGDYTQSARYVSVRHAMYCIAIREEKCIGNKLLWPIKSYVLYNRYFYGTGIPFCRIIGYDVNQCLYWPQ